jgi:hypothetical protein
VITLNKIMPYLREEINQVLLPDMQSISLMLDRQAPVVIHPQPHVVLPTQGHSTAHRLVQHSWELILCPTQRSRVNNLLYRDEEISDEDGNNSISQGSRQEGRVEAIPESFDAMHF